MKVVSVVGGTGMLGVPVCKALQKNGFKVRVISRDIAKAEQTLGAGFEYKQADLTKVAELKQALKGSHGIHINASGNSKASYYKNHVLGTQNILEAVKGEPIEFIGMISTASAYPEHDQRWDNKYKLEAEQLLKNSGLRYLVFMPSWFMETLNLFVQKQKIVHIGPSTKGIHWISANDYAQIVADTYLNKAVRNQRIPIFGPEALTMTTAIRLYAEHHQLKVQKLPAWLTQVIGRLTKDNSLIDIADLAVHYDRFGERKTDTVLRTTLTLPQWLQAQ